LPFRGCTDRRRRSGRIAVGPIAEHVPGRPWPPLLCAHQEGAGPLPFIRPADDTPNVLEEPKGLSIHRHLVRGVSVAGRPEGPTTRHALGHVHLYRSPLEPAKRVIEDCRGGKRVVGMSPRVPRGRTLQRNPTQDGTHANRGMPSEILPGPWDPSRDVQPNRPVRSDSGLVRYRRGLWVSARIPFWFTESRDPEPENCPHIMTRPLRRDGISGSSVNRSPAFVSGPIVKRMTSPGTGEWSDEGTRSPLLAENCWRDPSVESLRLRNTLLTLRTAQRIARSRVDWDLPSTERQIALATIARRSASPATVVIPRR